MKSSVFYRHQRKSWVLIGKHVPSRFKTAVVLPSLECSTRNFNSIQTPNWETYTFHSTEGELQIVFDKYRYTCASMHGCMCMCISCIFINTKNTKKHAYTDCLKKRRTWRLERGKLHRLFGVVPTKTILNVHTAPDFFDFGMGSARYLEIGLLVLKIQDFLNIPTFYRSYAHDFSACVYVCCFSSGFPKLKRCF